MGKNKHPHNKLTAAAIRNAKPGRHPDGNCLYLDVDDNGAKHWLLRVVIHGRRHAAFHWYRWPRRERKRRSGARLHVTAATRWPSAGRKK